MAYSPPMNFNGAEQVDVPLSRRVSTSTAGQSEDGGLTRRLEGARRAALHDIDSAPFHRMHTRVGLVAGVGFFTSAYDIFSISMASVMLDELLKRDHNGVGLTSAQKLGIKIATPLGTLVGQLVFGRLADVYGRKRLYGLELAIVILATFCQALVGWSDAINMISVLIFWRVLMGVGVGGDYPLSAVIASEFSSAQTRGRLMAAVFASQGLGNLTASLVSLAVTAYGNDSLDQMWRMLVGFGCVPAAIALYFRLTIPETPRFTFDIKRNVQQATEDVSEFLKSGTQYLDPDAVMQAPVKKGQSSDMAGLFRHFTRWNNFKVIMGAAYSWFALDIVFYGIGLNSSTLLGYIGWSSLNPDSNSDLRRIALGNLILVGAGTIPGYLVSIALIDRVGRKPLQFWGFMALSVLYIILGFALTSGKSSVPAFMVVCCLVNFVACAGPNPTTFIVPAEVSPTRYRATAHGFAAACGKLGAVVAQIFFEISTDNNPNLPTSHLRDFLRACLFFTVTGAFATILIPETNQKSLEDLSIENSSIDQLPAERYPYDGA